MRLPITPRQIRSDPELKADHAQSLKDHAANNRGSDGDGGETMGWLDVFLDTIACATAVLADGSEANV